ncbi:MAG: hypothetical protein ACLFNN_00280, partial [Candidatus Paceibacterota bacterium]
MEKDLNDKKFISTREASKLTGYTTDYIGQLCRGGLVIARKDGKGWLVQEDDLLRYKEGISLGIPQYENKPGNPKVSGPVESIYNKRSSNTDTDNIKNISSSAPLGYTSHSKVAVAGSDPYGRDEVKVSESMSAKNTSGEKNSGSQIPPSAKLEQIYKDTIQRLFLQTLAIILLFLFFGLSAVAGVQSLRTTDLGDKVISSTRDSLANTFPALFDLFSSEEEPSGSMLAQATPTPDDDGSAQEPSPEFISPWQFEGVGEVSAGDAFLQVAQGQGSLEINVDTLLSSDLEVLGDATFQAVDILGPFSVEGLFTAAGGLNVIGPADLETLSVSGDVTLSGVTDIADLTVSGPGRFTDSVVFEDDAEFLEYTSLTDMEVFGTSTFLGTSTFQGPAGFSQLTVSTSTDLFGTTTVHGSGHFLETINATGGMLTGGADINLQGGRLLGTDLVMDVEAGNKISVNEVEDGVFRISSTAGSGAPTAGEDIAVDGREVSNISTIGSVAGRTSGISWDEDLERMTIGGTSTLDHGLDIEGTLSVSGTTTLAGVTYTWPDDDGLADHVLTTDGSGGLEWKNADSLGAVFTLYLEGDSGDTQEIEDQDTVTISGGTGISTLAEDADSIRIDLDDTEVTPDEYGTASSTTVFTV